MFPKLVAFDYIREGYDGSDAISQFLEKNGSTLRHFKSYGGNDKVLTAVLDHCPLIVEQGEWDLRYNWDCLSETVFYQFIDKAGPTMKTFLPGDSFGITAPSLLEEVAGNCPIIQTLGGIPKCTKARSMFYHRVANLGH